MPWAGLRWYTVTKVLTQVKFTIESEIVSSFKVRCTSEGVSMAAVVRQWMINRQPTNSIKIKTDNRGQRKKAVIQIISLLTDILDMEANYREAIPEQFEQRIYAADNACDKLADAIACLAEAFE